MIEAITFCTDAALHYFGWQFSFHSLLEFFKGHCWVILVEELIPENEKDQQQRGFHAFEKGEIILDLQNISWQISVKRKFEKTQVL